MNVTRRFCLLSIVSCLIHPTLHAADYEFLFSGSSKVVRVSSSGTQSPFASGFTGITGLAFDSASNVFVSDNLTGIINKYSPTGAFLGNFLTLTSNTNYELKIDPFDNVYVTDAGSHHLRKFSPSGQLIFDITQGMASPSGIVFEPNGNLLIAMYNGTSIRRYSPAGVDLGLYASSLTTPMRLAYDSSGNLYVSENIANRVRKFSPTGTDLGFFVNGGALQFPDGIIFDPDGNAYIGDEGSQLVRKYSSTGQDLGIFTSNLPAPMGMLIRNIAVPEPGSLALAGLVAIGGVGLWWRRKVSSLHAPS